MLASETVLMLALNGRKDIRYGNESRVTAGKTAERVHIKGGINVYKLNFFTFLTVMLFLFLTVPTFGFSWEYEINQAEDSGSAIEDVPIEEQNIPSFLTDERILDLRKDFDKSMIVLSNQLVDESDPVESERLQSEVHKLKLQQEIAEKEMNLEIATEQGDKAKVKAITARLDSLYSPRSAKPAFDEPIQNPWVERVVAKELSKNPDDASKEVTP